MGKSKVFKVELRNNEYSFLLVKLLYLTLVMLLLTETVNADLYKYRNLQGNDKQTGSGTKVLRLDEKYPGAINNLRGKPGQGYHIEVEIGTPKQKLHVLIDTGSSNFAVACADDPYITTFFDRARSSTYRDIGKTVEVPYTEGKWSGVLGNDVVSITSLPNVTVHANIACITESEQFYINGSNWQGILGLGYANIARPDSSVVPFMDSMVEEGHINNYFSMALCGRGSNISGLGSEEVGGSVLFGGTDDSLYSGPVYSTPINKEWYYEVIIVDIEVDYESLQMDCKEYNFGKTIVDSGTTNLRLPTRVFNSVLAKMKAYLKPSLEFVPVTEGFWTGDELLCWDIGMEIDYDVFPTLSLTLPINTSTAFKLVVSPQQYLRPVATTNDTVGQNCFKLAITGSESGSVIGAAVMEGFYVIFNRAEKTIQFAVSKCNVIDKSAVRSYIQGNISLSDTIYQADSKDSDQTAFNVDYTDCAYAKISTSSSTLTIVGYVMAGLCGLCVLPLVVLVLHWQVEKCRKTRRRAGSDSNGLVENSS